MTGQLDLDTFIFCRKCKKELRFKIVGEPYEVTFDELITKSESASIIENKIPIISENDENDGTYETVQELFLDERKYVKTTTRIAEILKCPVCEEVVFRLLWYESDELAITKSPIFDVFPKHEHWYETVNQEINQTIPSQISEIYEELIASFNSSFRTATGTLARTLIELICDEQKMTEAVLKKKIDKLPLKSDFITALHNIRDLGNIVVHKAYQGDRKELSLVIKAIERLLVEIYFPLKNEQEIKNISKALEEYKPTRR